MFFFLCFSCTYTTRGFNMLFFVFYFLDLNTADIIVSRHPRHLPETFCIITVSVRYSSVAYLVSIDDLYIFHCCFLFRTRKCHWAGYNKQHFCAINWPVNCFLFYLFIYRTYSEIHMNSLTRVRKTKTYHQLDNLW